MTTGHVVDYDADTATYSLPAHRAGVLTRAAGPNNLALVAQFLPLLGEVEQKIIGCFRAGGGLPYSEFPRFHALMAEESGAVFDAALVDVVLPLVDGLRNGLRSGADVADFGCGSGHAINVMARAFPASRFTGIDFSDEAIAVGTRGGGSPRAGERDLRKPQPGASWTRRRATTSSPCSTPSTTRRSRRACWKTSIGRCGPAVCC